MYSCSGLTDVDSVLFAMLSRVVDFGVGIMKNFAIRSMATVSTMTALWLAAGVPLVKGS